MASGLRIVHAGDLTTAQATSLRWRVGHVSQRFQEIAVADDEKVVGSWMYEHPEAHGRRTWLQSARTDVAKGYQGRGLATRLWFHGIERWNPTRIIASYVSGQGRVFLGRMFAELALRRPLVFLDVNVDKEHDTWAYEKMYAAERLLKSLGTNAAARGIVTPQLTAIAGGKS